MKKEPYIITDDLDAKKIAEMIRRAYDEGYSDGYESGMKVQEHTVPQHPNFWYSTNPCIVRSSDHIEISC